ncbi:MAG: hypothetical protein V5A46_02375 [Haloferacaceae archaeon]
MVERTASTDMGLGLMLALSAVAVVGALLLYGGGTQLDQAFGFLVAIVAASLAVSAIHLFDA